MLHTPTLGITGSFTAWHFAAKLTSIRNTSLSCFPPLFFCSCESGGKSESKKNSIRDIVRLTPCCCSETKGNGIIILWRRKHVYLRRQELRRNDMMLTPRWMRAVDVDNVQYSIIQRKKKKNRKFDLHSDGGEKTNKKTIFKTHEILKNKRLVSKAIKLKFSSSGLCVVFWHRH